MRRDVEAECHGRGADLMSEAFQRWRYVTTTGYQVSVTDIYYGMHPMSAYPLTEASMFLHLRLELTLPGLGKGVSWYSSILFAKKL